MAPPPGRTKSPPPFPVLEGARFRLFENAKRRKGEGREIRQGRTTKTQTERGESDNKEARKPGKRIPGLLSSWFPYLLPFPFRIFALPPFRVLQQPESCRRDTVRGG